MGLEELDVMGKIVSMIVLSKDASDRYESVFPSKRGRVCILELIIARCLTSVAAHDRHK